MEDQNETMELLKKAALEQGWDLSHQPHRFPLIEQARLSLRHAISGCKPIAMGVWDPMSQRIIHTGRICPVCEREFPHG